jgi:hypothetical protein
LWKEIASSLLVVITDDVVMWSMVDDENKIGERKRWSHHDNMVLVCVGMTNSTKKSFNTLAHRRQHHTNDHGIARERS